MLQGGAYLVDFKRVQPCDVILRDHPTRFVKALIFA